MMKSQIFATFFTLSTLFSIPLISQTGFAKEQLTSEQIKLQKDQIQYKAYIPKTFHLFEAIEGDLNKDGAKDLVLIVKATDPSQWVNHEYRGKLDRNRRGIIVLFNQKGSYKKVIQNLSCFSSENEEGGVYFAPDLWFEIKNNVLNIHYAHGRYGAWGYRFRLEKNDMRLIGYDDTNNHGPYIESQTSINFLTAKKLERKNMNEDPESDPQFKETWSKINVKPIFLSEIKNFDELNVP